MGQTIGNFIDRIVTRGKQEDETIDALQQQFKFPSILLLTTKKGYELSIVYGKLGQTSRIDPSQKPNFQGKNRTNQGQQSILEKRNLGFSHAGLLVEVFNGNQMKQFLFEVVHDKDDQRIVWKRTFDYQRWAKTKEFKFCIEVKENQIDMDNLEFITYIEKTYCSQYNNQNFNYKLIFNNSQDFASKTSNELKQYCQQQQNYKVIECIKDRIKQKK